MEAGGDATGEALRLVAARFDWPPVGALAPVAAWGHRRAQFRRYADAGSGLDVVVKADRRWGPEEPARLYEDGLALARLLEQAGAGVTVAQPMGWHGEPPLLCMAFVEGTQLNHALRALAAGEGTAEGWDPPAVMARCGRALGAFHAASAVPGTGVGTVTARSYLDFGPYNVLLTEGGGLVLIDLPPTRTDAPVHLDAATFTSEIRRALGPAPFARSVHRRWLGLREAFLEGYAATGPGDLRAAPHRRRLERHESARMAAKARQRLRAGRFREAATFAATAARLLAR